MRFICDIHKITWDDQNEICCPECKAELPRKQDELGLSKSELETKRLLDQIQEIRARNNENWMGILRLAFKHAPEEAKGLMQKITECDGQINELTKELGETEAREDEK